MKIRLDVDGAAVAATLDDNDTARDFASQLPLTLTLEDYASAEKIADLPRRLSTNGAPAGTTASVGDVSYYAPWGTPVECWPSFYPAHIYRENPSSRYTGWPTTRR